MVDEQQAHSDAYRLDRMDNGRAIPLAIFYSAAEALAVLGCMVGGYRLMLGDRQVWPASGGHDGIAS
ncbi:hypothetical protein BPNPMPFG_007503 (plasmid) [Mesorhizobium sp. AR07]|uniref:hypothetical protein n=1 Tax=Mesorhizobium sp. AR07 TaxID=2865838 RepID=UPI002160A42E|nr:hypothetical protein [Mesorhizobium sp. AR07]UVK48184.1 hypothetical protein BPNPMPFG_007503 [Mesorhizobium sp. AR07]